MAADPGHETPTMPKTLFRRTRTADLDRELAELRAAHARIAPGCRLERAAIDQTIRGLERLRRRLGAGLPATRAG